MDGRGANAVDDRLEEGCVNDKGTADADGNGEENVAGALLAIV